MTHARLSPSSRHRWAICPASVNESKDCENKSGASALDGTFTHILLEKCINNNLSNADQLIGEKLKYDGKEIRITKQRAERVNVALTYLQNTKYHAIKSEYKVNPSILTGRDDLYGTIDLLLLSGDGFELIDYKDGKIPVSVGNNPQLMQYAVGVMSEIDGFEKEDIVTLTIIQPRANPQITHFHTTVGMILKEAKKLKSEADLTDQEWAPHVKGEHCMFCPAKEKCKEFNKSEIDGLFKSLITMEKT